MDYKELCKKIEIYKKNYNVKVIGKSTFGKKIYAVEKIVNRSFSTAIFVSSIHARENISSDLLAKFLDDDLFSKINKFNLSFILMANPDGVELSQNWLDSAPKKYRKFLKEINGSEDFSLWKANGRGVDLNNNFNANFGTNTSHFSPASSGFAGKRAESERETKAIVRYIKKMKPFFCVAYHTKGEEIYFNFFQKGKDLERDSLIANNFAKSTGYTIKNVEKVSSGGLKDYLVQTLKIPAITVELGSDDLSHPIQKEHLNDIFLRNKNIANDLIKAYNIFNKFKQKSR